ncbi:MAG TPA: Hsp33 family molecular chaperone HslO [Chthoniobacteraceae bacterium]|nr:Hsp33 family molecular chaperone HslO [Chthoniobacteraceae bacterium]
MSFTRFASNGTMMNPDVSKADTGLEVRSYFVRGRNALLTRSDFGELYVDYYLHQGQHGYQHHPEHDGLLKQALAAITLHAASRPWNESTAWTIHLRDPLLNLFVAGDNRLGTVVGQLFTDNVKDDHRQLFVADVVRERADSRRSAVEFEGTDIFRAVEHYYSQSEQRPARFFRFGPEDFVFISAQPKCDLAWLAALDDAAITTLDQREELSLLEQRRYRWECGCTQSRMFAILANIMRTDPDGLFGEEPVLRISCPRCGARHTITRESLEAYVAGAE